MTTDTGAEPSPPRSTDAAGWRRAVERGDHRFFRLEEIVAAIQDLGPCSDKAVLNPLATHLSDALLAIIRQHVSIDHPNRGQDIIERTHAQIIDALLRPNSADGKALREAFVPRVKFRIKDALAVEARAARLSYRLDDEAMPMTEEDSSQNPQNAKSNSLRYNPTSTNDESIDAERVLARIRNDQKRLAFRLFMDGIPFKSKKSHSISVTLGISEKTARAWIKEVQELLASVAEVKELLKIRDTRGTP